MLHRSTITTKEKLKRLISYDNKIQTKLIDLAVQDKIIFYLIKQNGQLHQLNSGDVEKINTADPHKAHIIIEPHHSGIHAFENCGWKQVWVNDEIAQSLLKETSFDQISNSDDAFPYTEKRKMLETIFGMAMHAYHYDPSSPRNAATGSNKDSISAGIQSVGLNVSDDTIRHYLNEAKEIFPHVKPIKS